MENDLDWSQAPKWAKFWAQDGNGAAYWYSSLPFLSNMMVAWNGGGRCVRYNGDYKVEKWTGSLRRRPANEA